jgi:hypothetical protein
MNLAIMPRSDPFKKYWWVLLLVFAGAGSWLCLPALTTDSSGAVAVNESGLRVLDSAKNPEGATGSPMGRSERRGGVVGAMKSSLDFLFGSGPAVEGNAAPNAQAAAGADSGWGSEKAQGASDHSSSASDDSSGWGGEKAQRGFSAPRANFGAMSGMSGESGSGASWSSGSSGSSHVSGFGGKGPTTGRAQAQSVGSGSARMEARAAGGSGAPGSKSSAKDAAAGLQNLDSLAGAGRTFDNSGKGNGLNVAGGSSALGEAKAALSSLNAAPVNLKANAKDLDMKEVSTIPKPQTIPAVTTDPTTKITDMLMNLFMAGIVGEIMGPGAGGLMGSFMNKGGSSSTSGGS